MCAWMKVKEIDEVFNENSTSMNFWMIIVNK
jgi:hypothetical protein